MLDELKAEFDAMMADGDDEAPADDEMPMDMDSEEGDDDEEEMEAFEASDEEVEESKMPKSETEIMREYVTKMSDEPKKGDNGANAKSPVAGKNDMGGTSANIAKGGTVDNGGTAGGLAKPTTTEDDAGNVNVPGGNGATKMASQPGHGAEKKGKPEQAANKKSTIGS
jgi:hypothetical protein